MHPGLIIKRLREEYKISRTELAQKSDLSLSFLNDLERGKKEPTIISLKKVCDAFDISIQEFFIYDLKISELSQLILAIMKVFERELTQEQLQYLGKFLESINVGGIRYSLWSERTKVDPFYDPEVELADYNDKLKYIGKDLNSITKFESLSEAISCYSNFQECAAKVLINLYSLKDKQDPVIKSLCKLTHKTFLKVTESLMSKFEKTEKMSAEFDPDELGVLKECMITVKDQYEKMKSYNE